MGEKSLKADNVSFDVRGKSLLVDVDLSVASGEFLAICGPNGAGKSTLLKCLSGELRPTRGHVRLDGQDLAAMAAAKLAQRRAVVPQSTELAFPFKVHEVVGLGLNVPGFAVKTARQDLLVDNALEAVEMQHAAGRLYLTLSGGERQRVHLARAICQLEAAPVSAETKVLLLDEPTSSLDLAHQLQVLGHVRRIAAGGVAVAVVMHDLNLASHFADSIALLSRGQLAVVGSPLAVMNNEMLSEVFECQVRCNQTPTATAPFVLPQACEAFENN
ncbi:MAG: heme ABC transporter ATP-binding protein [Pseudomonadota bacterium]